MQNSSKFRFRGGYYKEINDNLKKAYGTDRKVDYVIRCLDYGALAYDKDLYRTDAVYPEYLYNDNPADDVSYLFNKNILFRIFRIVKATVNGGETTSFDDYANWNAYYTFGAEAVLTYTLGEVCTEPKVFTEADREVLLGNIRQNVTSLAQEHPETTFYLFFSPYSICNWDIWKNNGEVDFRIDAEQAAIEELLKYPNIKLYSFSNNFEMICNLDNYKDAGHYGEWVNSWMLQWMRDGDYLLTEANYEEYLETIREFYHSYDYASLRE